MRYKYLSISGMEIESSTEKTKDELLSSFEDEFGNVISATPIVEIDGVPYWNENTDFSSKTISKAEWIERVCPQLVRVYG